jgi:hypothetical protein
MDTHQIVEHARQLKQRIQQYARRQEEGDPGEAARAQVCEFLAHYAGPQSAFTKQAEATTGFAGHRVSTLSSILESFAEYLESGLSTGLSPERRAQIDVVSDFLGQAQAMLDGTDFHPGAAAVLIGASLEEFLRNWVEAENVSLGSSRLGIDTYAQALKGAGHLSKQDVKDITSWAGTRNHAAHGEWDKVGDIPRVRLMLEGVNLFIRQKTG